MSLTRRILWRDEDESASPPTPPGPPSPPIYVDGLIPTVIGVWGALAARPGPGADLRVPGSPITYPFNPSPTPIPSPIVPTTYSGAVAAIDPLAPVALGVWGNLQRRPQPGEVTR